MQSVLQFTTGLGPKPVQPDGQSGRTAVAVGGAFGIGFDVSRALAGEGCRMLMVNQKQEQEGRMRGRRSRPSLRGLRAPAGGATPGGTTTGPARLPTWLLSAGINTNEFGLDRDGIDRHFDVNFARPVLRRQPAVAAAAQDGQAVRRRSGRSWDSAPWALTSDKVQNHDGIAAQYTG
ncbi:uncharacterized protein P884DRAFT_300766 [Thermothelomyces heterothallicus CBS 202.75]|uniref:uncharacterized protein n=1 Tax=Thermothelomyces heterothallicus CBS 202.75 TaxID=1149848 RepID=UPI0037444671